MTKTFQIGTVSNAQRVGRRILAFHLALILGLSSSPAIASPVTIKYKTYFSATFANSYKLKKIGCGYLKFTFKVSNDLVWPDHLIFLRIRNSKGTSFGGVSFEPGNSDTEYNSNFDYAGVEYLKVCREDWVDTDSGEEGDSLRGLRNGTYYIDAVVVQARPWLQKSTNRVSVKITG